MTFNPRQAQHPTAAINHPGTPSLLAEYDADIARDRRGTHRLTGISWALALVLGLSFVATGAKSGFLATCFGIATAVGSTGLILMLANLRAGNPRFRQELLATLALNEWVEYPASHIIIAEAAREDWKIVKLHISLMVFVILRKSEDGSSTLCRGDVFEQFRHRHRKNPILRHTHGSVLVAGDPLRQTAIATTPNFDHMYLISAARSREPLETFIPELNDTYRRKLKPYLEHYLGRSL